MHPFSLYPERNRTAASIPHNTPPTAVYDGAHFVSSEYGINAASPYLQSCRPQWILGLVQFEHRQYSAYSSHTTTARGERRIVRRSETWGDRETKGRGPWPPTGGRPTRGGTARYVPDVSYLPKLLNRTAHRIPSSRHHIIVSCLLS